MLTPQELREFEEEIAILHRAGKIPYPVHLRGSDENIDEPKDVKTASYEQNLINIFNHFDILKSDYKLGYWDSHLICLLSGVPIETLKQAILDGKSIALSFPEYKIYCSGIVGSLMGMAAGIGEGLKLQKSSDRVFIFLGDMSSYCGIFMESLLYVTNHNLPVHFIIADNGHSVMTPTQKVWGHSDWGDKRISLLLNNPHVSYFHYLNKWPHSGTTKKIAF